MLASASTPPHGSTGDVLTSLRRLDYRAVWRSSRQGQGAQCLRLNTGAGGGDYHLTGGTNNAYDRVPSGMVMLTSDLGGRASQ